MLLSRRKVMGSAASAAAMPLCACPCSARSARIVESAGCVLSAAEAERLSAGAQGGFSGTEEVVPRSGDREFDYALAQTLGKISALFEVTPGFAYYDDFDGPNAYATTKVRMGAADGTVLFGQRFLKQLRAGHEAPEVAVAAVCAHEFGHILQFKHGLTARVRNGAPTVKRTELQADFFSGYFAGRRRKERPSYPAAVGALAQYNVGDSHFQSPQHHGTPQERGAAFVRGYEVAYRENRTLAEAIDASIAYASVL